MTRGISAGFFMARGSVHCAYNFLERETGSLRGTPARAGDVQGLRPVWLEVGELLRPNANAQQQVIAQRISDQFLERCSAHTALVVELCGNPAVHVNDYESLIDIVSTRHDAGVS